MATKDIRYVNKAAKKAVQSLPQPVAIDFLNDITFIARDANRAGPSSICLHSALASSN